MNKFFKNGKYYLGIKDIYSYKAVILSRDYTRKIDRYLSEADPIKKPLYKRKIVLPQYLEYGTFAKAITNTFVSNERLFPRAEKRLSAFKYDEKRGLVYSGDYNNVPNFLQVFKDDLWLIYYFNSNEIRKSLEVNENYEGLKNLVEKCDLEQIVSSLRIEIDEWHRWKPGDDDTYGIIKRRYLEGEFKEDKYIRSIIGESIERLYQDRGFVPWRKMKEECDINIEELKSLIPREVIELTKKLKSSYSKENHLEFLIKIREDFNTKRAHEELEKIQNDLYRNLVWLGIRGFIVEYKRFDPELSRIMYF